MPRRLSGTCASVAVSAVLMALSVATLRGEDESPETFHDGFETPQAVWSREVTDAKVQLLAHDRSNRARHEGLGSERFQFEAGTGSAFYYSYALPHIVVTDPLQVGLYVRSNRVGVQLLGRVVLPADTDPDTGEPSFVLIPGTIYDAADRWQRLELVDLRPSIERQARVLRAASSRPVSLEGAYLDRLVVNLFGGPGKTEVFLDDLTIKPVSAKTLAERAPTSPNDVGTPKVEAERVPIPRSRVQLEGNRLRKDGNDWLVTGVEAPGADVGALRRGGFDVLVDDFDADPRRAREAIERGFLLMPKLGSKDPGEALGPARAREVATASPYRDSVAFWHLGDRLGATIDPADRTAEWERIRAVVASLRDLPRDAARLTTANVSGEFYKYARAPRGLDMIGVRPLSWGAMQDPLDTYAYLSQRRALTTRGNPGGLFWAWIDVTPPPAVRAAVWGLESPPDWGLAGVQPEQVRLATYTALAAGYRGLGFRGDADLTQPRGRQLLIELGLLNEEIDLFESILAQGSDPIPLYRTDLTEPVYIAPMVGMRTRTPPPKKEPVPHPTIRAAAIETRDRRGLLLLVADFAPGAQYQPPQMAINDLKITVPVPESAQAFEISPGEVRVLDHTRVPGGRQVTVPEFGVTSMVLVTTDMGLKDRIEAAMARVRPRAVALAIEQAQLQLQGVLQIHERLVADGHTVRDSADLLVLAEKSIRSAGDAQEREDYPLAWAETRRATRPLRSLMRVHWQDAVDAMAKATSERDAPRTPNRPPAVPPAPKDAPLLVMPVASPACVAFQTLPQHFLWVDWMRLGKFGPNGVPSGTFDDPEAFKTSGWVDQSYPMEGYSSQIRLVPGGRDGSKRMLKMRVGAKDPSGIDKLPPFIDLPVAAVRSPAVRVGAKQFVRISVLVHRPIASIPGAGGVIVRDSIGGETLQFRTTDPIPELSRVVLYRRVPADGELTVTLGLAGYGDVFFDDLKIEPVVSIPPAVPQAMDDLTRLRRPDPPSVRSSAARPESRGRTNR